MPAPLPVRPDTVPQSPPAVWLERLGDFAWQDEAKTDATIHVLEREGRLRVVAPGIDAQLAATADADVFHVTDTDDDLRFQRDDQGTITGVLWRAHLAPRHVVPAGDSDQLQITPVQAIGDLLPLALAAQPPQAAGAIQPDLVAIASVDASIRLDIRYATTENFLGSRFYDIAGAWLQRPVVQALARVSENLRAQGYGLQVFDGYRPWFVTWIFWEAMPVPLRWLVADPARGSRHNRGSAVDLTLYDLKTGQPVPMTGTYDEASVRSHADYPGGTSRQCWMRALLRASMEAEGFVGIASEWWHFDHKDWERYPILNLPFEALAGRGPTAP